MCEHIIVPRIYIHVYIEAASARWLEFALEWLPAVPRTCVCVPEFLLPEPFLG